MDTDLALPLLRPRARGRPAALASASWPLVAILALGAAIRLAGIGHQGYWYDEAHTVFMTKVSLPDMLGALRDHETTPPLYFVVAWLWSRVVGSGEAELRLLSAVLGMVSIPLLFEVARTLVSRRAGLVAAALAASNPLLIWYSQEARAYALLIAVSSITLLAFVRLRDRIAGRPLAIWAAAAGLALCTHYFAALLVAPQLIWLWHRHRGRLDVRRAVLVVTGCGVLLAPLLLSQLHALGGRDNWINAVPLGSRLTGIPAAFAAGYSGPGRGWVLAVVAAAVLVALSVLRIRGDADERRGAAFAWRQLAAGTALVAISLVAGLDEVDVRNVIVVLLPIILIVAAGIGARRAGAPGIAAGAVICFAGAFSAIGVALDPAAYGRPDWRPVAAALARPSGSPERAILVVGGCQALPLALYVPRLELPAGDVRTRELDLIGVGRPDPWATACAGAGVPLPRALAGLRAVGPVRRIGQFSLEVLRSPRSVTLRWRFVAGRRYVVGRLNGVLMQQRAG